MALFESTGPIVCLPFRDDLRLGGVAARGRHVHRISGGFCGEGPVETRYFMSEHAILFATGGFDNAIKLWKTHNGDCFHSFKHPDSQVNALQFSSNRKLLAAAGYEHVRLYDTVHMSHDCQVQINSFQRNVNTLGFSEDCRWMFTGGEDCYARIFDIRSKNHACVQMFQARGSINTAVLYRNQYELIIGDDEGEVNIWDIRNDANNQMLKPDVGVLGACPPATSVQSVAVNSEGTSMAMLNAHGTCFVWSLGGSTVTKCFARSQIDKSLAYGLKVEFSPDSTLMVLCGAERQFKVLKTADFSVMATYEVPSPGRCWVWDCAFSADSQYLLTASSDGLGRLWNLDTGKVDKEYRGHQRACTCLAFREQPVEASY